MIDDPVEKASSSSINLNSHEHHAIISSENLERCIIIRERAEASSMQKSLSDTESREFKVGPSKPRMSAVISLSVGYVVPARAQAPSGLKFMRFTVSLILPTSLMSIDA